MAKKHIQSRRSQLVVHLRGVVTVKALTAANHALQAETTALRDELLACKDTVADYTVLLRESDRSAKHLAELVQLETDLRVKAQADLAAALTTIRNLSR